MLLCLVAQWTSAGAERETAPGTPAQSGPSQKTPQASSISATDVGIPVRFELPKASYVTLVMEDAHGRRVRNLIAETKLPAGENVVYWDGYEEGATTKAGDFVRRRAPEGEYHVR